MVILAGKRRICSHMFFRRKYVETNFIFCDECPPIRHINPRKREVKAVTRICIFCETWESGGIEAFLTNVISHMDLTGLEIDIVSARLGQSVFTAPLKELGVGFYQLSGRLRTPENGKRFAQLLRKRQYDVVHLNIFQGLALYYGRLAQKYGVPVRIAHCHGAGLRNSPGVALKLKLHELGKRLWSGCATTRLACSRQAAEFLFPKGMSYEWIPNGIDAARFCFQAEGRGAVRRELGIEEDTLLGTVGRLSAEKNQGFLLKVLREVKAKAPNAVLLLVGGGQMEEALRQRAEETGVSDSVIFYGESPRIPELLWAMDVFLFPSTTEGLGIAAVEAQAAGLPVVCSEHIPGEALVTEGVTRLPLSAGAGAWAEAALKAKAPLDRTAAAKEVSAAGYDVEAVAERIREVWME